MKTCCEHNADKLPHGCNQGRDCPCRGSNSEPLTLADVLDAPPFSPNLMMLATALCGLLSIAIVIGGLAWLVYTIAPIVASSFN